MLWVIIIDDIDIICEWNSVLIVEYCFNVVLIVEVDSVELGLEVICKYLLDLVFFDVELVDGMGFDLLC